MRARRDARKSLISARWSGGWSFGVSTPRRYVARAAGGQALPGPGSRPPRAGRAPGAEGDGRVASVRLTDLQARAVDDAQATPWTLAAVEGEPSCEEGV